MTDRVHLPGGSGGVWSEHDPLRGRIVHRPAGPWTSAVHELLRSLRRAGLDGIPEVIGFDSDGREMLSFVAGHSPPAGTDPSDAILAGAAAWLRRFHDASAQVRLDARVWRQGALDLAPGQIICHNDTGTYNWIVEADRFAGMIDWDQAGPGHPLDDLAFLCWTGVPLLRPTTAADAAHRLALAADAYGGVAASALLEAVADRMTRAVSRISAGIERGDAGMLSLQAKGEPARTRGRLESFLERRAAIRAELPF